MIDTTPENPVKVDERGQNAENVTDIPPRGWLDVLKRVKNQFSEDHVTLAAAGVAFFGFLAMVPLIIAGVSIWGIFASPSDVTAMVENFDESVPQEVASMIEQQLTSVSTSSGGALGLAAVISIAAALWSASSGMTHLMEALNIAYNEDPDDRPFWKRRGLAIAMTVGALVLFALVGTVVSLTAAYGSGIGGLLLEIAGWAVGAAFTVGAVATLYKHAANRDNPEWQWTSPGAVFAVVGWLAASIGLRFYVSRFGSYNETYGTMAAVVILLLWLYLSAIIVIVGAEINSELERQTGADTTVGPDEPMGTRDAIVADSVAVGGSS